MRTAAEAAVVTIEAENTVNEEQALGTTTTLTGEQAIEETTTTTATTLIEKVEEVTITMTPLIEKVGMTVVGLIEAEVRGEGAKVQ